MFKLRLTQPLCLTSAAVALALLIGYGPAQRARAAGEHFADPSAQIRGQVELGDTTFVGPFANLIAPSGHKISIGAEANVQDNVTLNASRGNISLGEQVIIAHGATVSGAAELGEHGTCPHGEAHCPSFVGFNAEVDGATLEMDAMVGHLARLAPGLTLHSGLKVLPGKNITTQAEADDPAQGKVAALVDGDRDFMHGVIEVNVAFAAEYAHLAAVETSGINAAPGTTFNQGHLGPSVYGSPLQDGSFRNRIIGNVLLSNTAAQLDDVMGSHDSLRADEGTPFILGPIAFMGSNVTFHALEHTGIFISGGSRFESGSLVHGGPNTFNANTTTAGVGFRLGAKSVFFNSRIGALGRIGFKSAVLGTDFGLAQRTRIGDCQVINNGQKVGEVEWCY